MAAVPQPSDDSDLDHSHASSSDATGSDSSDESDFDDDNINPKWCNQTSGLKRIPFKGDCKLLYGIPGDNKPIDWFFFLVDDIFCEQICKFTNQYALELYCGNNTQPCSRICKFQDLTVPEFKIFLGLLLHMGSIKLNRYQDYWKTDRLYNIPVFRQYMSRDRFLIIMRCIYFCKPNDPNADPNDRLSKIQYLIHYFNSKMISVYSPAKELSLDESMVLWRGRLQFRQYIKGKRHRYGIKIYVLSEPEGLTLRMHVYGGKNDILSGKGHTKKVVLHLMRGLLNKGHSIYTDNFYNSVGLATNLLHHNTYVTGTLRSDRKLNPPEVVKANLKKGETKAQYSDGIMVGRWKDKRYVLYISTEFENEMATITNKRGVEKIKPLPIIHYNAHMKGVDRGDQLLAYHPCEHKTIRWYKKIFVHLIQVITVNSLHFYNISRPPGTKKMTLYDFRNDLIGALLPPKPEGPLVTPPRNAVHQLVKNDVLDKKGFTARKRCRVCAQDGKQKRTVYVCSKCPDKPGFCPVQCFDKFHKK